MHNKNLKNNLNSSHTFPSWRNFIKTGALFTTVTGLLLFASSCSSTPEEEMITVEQPSKGIITKVVEVQPGQYIVESEDIIDNPSASAAHITYLDGRKEIITAEEMSKRITDKDILAASDTIPHFTEAQAAADTAIHANSGAITSDNTQKKSSTVSQNGNTTTVTDADGNTTVVVNNTQPAYTSAYNPGLHTLSYVLMGSALGYYMGKSMMMPPNPNIYRNPTAYTTASSGSYGSSSSAGRTYSSLRSTSTRTSIPRSNFSSVSSGKSGYFGGKGSTAKSSSSSSGRSSGYSG